MRFLLVTKQVAAPPPEMALGLFDAMIAWVKKHTASKKLEQGWGFAGLPAGGGILNVNSLEELESIMSEFPMRPFASHEVFGLMDVQEHLQLTKQAIQAMMPPKGKAPGPARWK